MNKIITPTRKLNFQDVMIVPKKSILKSRKDVNLNVGYTFKNSKRDWSGIPLVCSNMDSISNYKMYNVLNEHSIMSCTSKHLEPYDYDLMYLEKYTFMPSMGIKESDFSRMDIIIDNYNPQFVCIDVANGYMDELLFAIDKFYENYYNKNITLCVGNVVTPERVELLINDFGVDIVKIGIGSGGVCTTSTKTGVGYPQLSAILECKEAAESNGGHIMSDGGIKTNGDIAKAFGAGADFVMLGSMLAGHLECDGKIIMENGEVYMKFHGMSSSDAMKKHSGGVSDYLAAEGKTTLVKFKGQLKDTIKDILGSLRSTCTYVGAENLKELYNNVQFIVI
jgi:GMP reductase